MLPAITLCLMPLWATMPTCRFCFCSQVECVHQELLPSLFLDRLFVTFLQKIRNTPFAATRRWCAVPGCAREKPSGCKNVRMGPFRGLNPGPPAPKAGIIPLDQMDLTYMPKNGLQSIHFVANTFLFHENDPRQWHKQS